MIPVTELLALLPPTLLDRLALQYQVNAVNQVRLSGQTMFVCLLNGLVNHPPLTLRLLEETYQQLTGHTADHSSFGKRLATLNPAYLDAIYQALQRQIGTQMSQGEQQALRLRRVDATTVVLSAKLLSFGIHVRSGGRAGPDRAKRHLKAVFTLSAEGLPACLHVCREQAEANDNPALGDPIIAASQPGDLWVVDGGLFDRDRLLAIQQQGACFLVPQHGQRLRELQTLWEAPAAADPPPPAAAAPADPPPRTPPCRLRRVALAVFENSNDALSPAQQAKWGRLPLVVLFAERYDLRARCWRPFVLLTNLPLTPDGQQVGPYSFAELLEVYRSRWAIELFFKFLKQHLSYAHLTSRSENGIQVMIRMALIAAVLLIWYKHRTGIDRGWRSVKFWFAEAVRDWTRQQLQLDLAPAALDSG